MSVKRKRAVARLLYNTRLPDTHPSTTSATVMSGNTAGKDKLKSIDKNQCVPRMKKLRGRIVRPAMSTAEIKASDERRKAEEEEEQRRKAEEELERRKAEVQERTSNFLQNCIDEKRAATPYESDDSDDIPVMGEAVPSGFGQKQWMEKRGLPYGGDDPNSWAKKRAAADGKDSVPQDGNPVSEDGNPVSEDQQSAPTYTRSHLQVDEKDWCDKREAKGKEVLESEHPITPRSPEDYDLFDGDEKAREEFCKYAAKQMFDGKMGW